MTRAEISGAPFGAFVRGPLHRQQLVAHARASGARDDVLTLLTSLPPYRCSDLTLVFRELPPLPCR